MKTCRGELHSPYVEMKNFSSHTEAANVWKNPCEHSNLKKYNKNKEMEKQQAEIIIIVAMGKQNQIGLNDTMPWHLRDDLQNFKKITSGHTIIMGRKTFDSIGKALPKRMNYVITSQPARINAYEVCSFNNLQKAIDKAKMFDDKIFIIGGASIYNQSLDEADRMIITHVNYSGDADTYFPDLDFNQWEVVEKKSFTKNKENDFDFEIVTYKKSNRI